MNGPDLEGIARALGGATRQGRGWLCFCPSHDNRKTPALSIDRNRPLCTALRFGVVTCDLCP